MFRFNSLTNVTLGYETSHFPLHFVPPKLFLQILVHLCSTGMNGIKSVMGFLQNYFLQLRICGYTKTFIIPKNSFFIFGNSRCLSCRYTALDSIDTFISLLGFFNLTYKG